ncbi:MAG: site-specific integrase, partial [Candidatus Nanoarchaeia archaeon]
MTAEEKIPGRKEREDDMETAMDMTMDIIEGQAREITYQPPPGDIAEDFLASLDVAKSSKGTYTRSLRQFIGWLDETGRQSLQLEREDILAYKAYMKDSLSAYTVNQYLTA